MLRPKFIPLVLKQAFRRPARSVLTVGGVATAMFLVAAVTAMQDGVSMTTRQSADDTALIVYQQNRYCPSASRLPESYGQRIAGMAGVVSVLPMMVVPSNCRTSLDVVTFRGVPADSLRMALGADLELADGSLDGWLNRKDGVLLGPVVARRRGLAVGDSFDAAGITVHVAGVLNSDQPQDMNAAYVHLDFLQRAAGRQYLGIVTQFNVRVDDPSRLDSVAGQIDAMFQDDQQPTQTSSQQGFIARAAADVIVLVSFMRYLGWGCLAAALALIGNSIVLSVQDRIKDHAVFQTLGFSSGLIARLIVAEALLLALLGGLLGTALALGIAGWGQFGISTEGLTIPVQASAMLLLRGTAIAALMGVAAGLVPALQASRRPITDCFRTL